MNDFLPINGYAINTGCAPNTIHSFTPLPNIIQQMLVRGARVGKIRISNISQAIMWLDWGGEMELAPLIDEEGDFYPEIPAIPIIPGQTLEFVWPLDKGKCQFFGDPAARIVIYWGT